MSYNNARHYRSRELAKKEIAARMKGHRSAVTVPSGVDGALQFIYSCLERMGTLITQEDQDRFYGIAIECLPLGSFNAQACFPPKEPPFVLVDTGTIDFAGNMAAVFMSLFSNLKGQVNFVLNEQKVIDYIWSAALIYHGQRDEWDNSLDAIYAPKLNFLQIPVSIQPHAFTLSIAQILFLICHEIGHVMTDKHPSLSDAMGVSMARNLEWQFDEFLADDFAFCLMVNYSIRWSDELKVTYLLTGVDFGLSCIHLMQSAFPVGVHNQEGKKIVEVSESLDHPIALARRERYREMIKSRGLNRFLETGYEFDRIMHPYAEMIRDGRKPSEGFRRTRETRKFIFGDEGE